MSSPYYLMLILLFPSRSSSLKVYKKNGLSSLQVSTKAFSLRSSTKPNSNSTTPNQTHQYLTELKHTTPNQTHPYQTELNQTKPNSSTPNQTQPNQTKLIRTKPNYTKPNQARQFPTKFDQPNWLDMHSRTISSFWLLLAILFILVILENPE